MVLFFVVLVLAVVVGTVAITAVLGRCWRFVMVRPTHRAGGSPLSRLSLRGPNADEYAEQQSVRTRLDAPFAAVFLAASLIVLAMPGFGEAWAPLLALWGAAAIIRWRDGGPASSFVRLGIVLLLAVESVIVAGFRGGEALPQAGAYVALALVGLGVLYRTNGLSLPFGPGGGDTGGLPPRRRARRVPSGASHSFFDTMPAAQGRIVRGSRQSVRPDDSGVLSPPYHPQHTASAGD